MIRVYHNPRCTKSREALARLDEKGVEYEVVEYMKEPLTQDELESVLEILDISAEELIRTNEDIWKSEFKGKELDEDELVLAMIEYPKLMQRPIVINGTKGVIARPTEKLDEVI